MRYVDIADFFLIAEKVLSETLGTEGNRVRDLLRSADYWRIMSALRAPEAAAYGEELWPTFADKAAVLCIRIARNRPLPDGNSAVALSAMLHFIAENGGSWRDPPEGDAEVIAVVEAMANHLISASDFAAWVAAQMA